MNNARKIAIGSDHGGAWLKNQIFNLIKKEYPEFEIKDFGGEENVSTDYPDMAAAVCDKIAAGEFEFGILVCGTGQGMAICANKFKGIRAVCATCPTSARFTREHNNANVLCLGGRISGYEVAADITKIFLTTAFAGGRHQRRVDKINECEKR